LKTKPRPKFVKINILNEDAVGKVKNEIKSYGIYNELNKSTTYHNYNAYTIV